MTNPGDLDQARSREEAAAETEEPEEAARMRAQDDAESRARLAQAEAGLKAADEAIAAGEARLRETRSELRDRERELDRTRDLARDVATNAATLRDQTDQIAEETLGISRRALDAPPAGPPTESDS